MRENKTISRRFIACTQSTGRIGKSTLAEGIITWLHFAGIKFAAIDADSQHRTLLNRYPNEVAAFDATKTLDDFARMIQTLPPRPVILVDFPAQATDFLLNAAKHFRLLEFFAEAQVCPTLLVFAADDPTAKESAANTARFFGESADYVVVENPARFKSDQFKRTALYGWLENHGSPRLKLPTTTSVTMNAWETLENSLKRYLPLEEATKRPELHELSRFELCFLRDRFLVQCEDAAGFLLPATDLIQQKVERPREAQAERIDRFNDPLLTTM
jgi:hypothetical protein